MKSRTHTLSGVGSSISGSVDLDDPLETQSAPSKHEKKAYSEQEKAIDPAKKNTMILFLYDQRRPAMIREIHSEETGKLYECLDALAEHHNKVSVHFKGSYPKTPSEERIKQFESELEEGKSRIAVIENGNDFVGFCKIGTEGNTGVLEYLFVLSRERGKGYGAALMDWALTAFRKLGLSEIDVKVVYGNEAIRLYEKYGFREKSVIMTLKR